MIIACVYKLGPKFSAEYVYKLYNSIKRNTTLDFSFICLTDDPLLLSSNTSFQTKQLLHDYPKWWSKLELFRPNLFDDLVYYFDLDTMFAGNIDLLLQVNSNDFMMLRGFNRRALRLGDVPASGMMSWYGNNMSYLFEKFSHDSYNIIEAYKNNKIAPGQDGDQGFIGDVVGWNNVSKFQDYLPEDYIIGKIDCGYDLPSAHIINWSGDPPLHAAKFKYKWMNEIWH